MNLDKEKIIITGTPGVGKSTVASKLGSKTGLNVLHVDSDFVESQGVSKGIDKEKESKEVDLGKLQEILTDFKGIIESHLLCEFNLPDSIVIVLRCNPESLKERIEDRDYPEEKVKENLEAEKIDYCTQRARENYSEVFEVETTDRDIEETVKECLKIIREENEGDKDIDFSDQLLSSF